MSDGVKISDELLKDPLSDFGNDIFAQLGKLGFEKMDAEIVGDSSRKWLENSANVD